jgi:hypothetical protein
MLIASKNMDESGFSIIFCFVGKEKNCVKNSNSIQTMRNYDIFSKELMTEVFQDMKFDVLFFQRWRIS